MRKDEMIRVRIKSTQKTLLKKIAKEKGTTMSAFLAQAIEEITTKEKVVKKMKRPQRRDCPNRHGN